MLIPARIFKLHKLTDTDTSRYALGGIRFERDADGKPIAIVTDGRVLLAVQWPEDNPDDYPAGQVGLSAEHKPGFAVVVPTDACKRVGKLPPRRSPKPVLRNVLLDEQSDNGTVPMGVTNQDEVQQVRPGQCEGKFPLWRDVYPRPTEEGRTVTVQLDARILSELLRTIEKAHDDRAGSCPVKVTFHLDAETDDDGKSRPMASRAWRNPVVVSAQTDNGTLLSGIIMPHGDASRKDYKVMEPAWVPEAEDKQAEEKP